ncbi:MAG: hypothetical protein QOE90_2309 [Thermoplasmata archaeon]|jgi:hypothetical protein|nr:hypothetical protein [Thermoplasmata archaeon]
MRSSFLAIGIAATLLAFVPLASAGQPPCVVAPGAFECWVDPGSPDPEPPCNQPVQTSCYTPAGPCAGPGDMPGRCFFHCAVWVDPHVQFVTPYCLYLGGAYPLA